MQNIQTLLPLLLICLCTGNSWGRNGWFNNGFFNNGCDCLPLSPCSPCPPYFNNLCILLLFLCSCGGGWGPFFGGGWNRFGCGPGFDRFGCGNGFDGFGFGSGFNGFGCGPGFNGFGCGAGFNGFGCGNGCYFRPHRGCGWGWDRGWW
jgi:hypothetical protein